MTQHFATDAQALTFVQGQAMRINRQVYETRYPDFDFSQLPDVAIRTSFACWFTCNRCSWALCCSLVIASIFACSRAAKKFKTLSRVPAVSQLRTVTSIGLHYS